MDLAQVLFIILTGLILIITIFAIMFKYLDSKDRLSVGIFEFVAFIISIVGIIISNQNLIIVGGFMSCLTGSALIFVQTYMG